MKFCGKAFQLASSIMTDKERREAGYRS